MTIPDGSTGDARASLASVGRASGHADGELSPVGLLNLMLRQRRVVLLWSTMSVVVFIGVRLLAPRSYTASSIFMPQTRSSLPSLSGLAAQFGLAVPGADPSQSLAFYSSLAKTRQILSLVAAGLYTVGVKGEATPPTLADLLEVDAAKDSLRRVRVIDKLQKMVTADVSLTTGTVKLDVTSRYPALSQQLNRRILDLLNQFNMETRQSRATQERQFTERRVAEAATELREAEDRLKSFLQRNRDYRNSPELTFQNDRLAREVAMRQQLYTTLAQALEQSKIEEVRDTPLITVVEAPEVPVRPDARGLALTGLLALVAGGVVGTLVALFRESAAAGLAARDRAWVEFVDLIHASGSDLRHPISGVRRLFRSRNEKTDPEIPA